MMDKPARRERGALDKIDRETLLDYIVESGITEGATQAMVCSHFNITHKQLMNFTKNHPDVREALDLQNAHAEAYWTRKMFEAVKSCKYNNGFPWIMANRFREQWQSMTRLEVSGKDGGPIEHADAIGMTPEQRMARMLELHNKISQTMKEKLGAQATSTVPPMPTSTRMN